jgi:hypothetical protein
LINFFQGFFNFFGQNEDYKRRANSTSIEKDAMFDMVYYIYPPVGSKLKSTRKSAWLNPVVGGEDALKLRGSKLLETPTFDRVWKLMRESTMSSTANKNMHKNTPDLTYKSPDLHELNQK